MIWRVFGFFPYIERVFLKSTFENYNFKKRNQTFFTLGLRRFLSQVLCGIKIWNNFPKNTLCHKNHYFQEMKLNIVNLAHICLVMVNNSELKKWRRFFINSKWISWFQMDIAHSYKTKYKSIDSVAKLHKLHIVPFILYLNIHCFIYTKSEISGILTKNIPH